MTDRAAGTKPEWQKRWWLTILQQRKGSPVAAVTGMILALLIAGPGTGCGSTRDDGGDEAGTEARPAPDRILLEMAGGIAAVNADGSGYKRLTDGSYGQEEGSGDWGAAWSPDGTRVAFVSIRDGNPAVYVMAADRSDQKNITNSPGGDGLFGLAWSPDGEQIAFVSVKAGESQDLYVINADGSDQLNLTGGGTLHPAGWAIRATEQLSWSPNGTLIAFASAPHEGAAGINPGGIVLARSDGSGVEELTAAMEMSPSWSPDGSRIAYLAGAGELHVMNADGSGDLLLAGGSKGSEVQSYAWSPDGTRLAFNYTGGQVYAADSDGSCRTPLTSDPYWTDSPTWSPDGSRIAYVANVGGGVGLWQMDADGSGEKKLDLPEDYGLSRAAWGPGAGGGVGGPGPLTCAADAAPADAMIIYGRVGYLEGVAASARTGEFQKSYVGAFAGGWGLGGRSACKCLRRRTAASGWRCRRAASRTARRFG